MRAEPPVPADALAKIRAPFLAAGATLVDPPVIQPLNLLLDLAGEAMRARLFIVQDEGGREACLRPDFTVPVARAHIDSGAADGRYMYEGKAFRVAPKGAAAAHPEEFVQIGFEAYGGKRDPAEDAAVASLAWRAANAGGRHDLAIRFGDVSLFSSFLGAIGIPSLTGRKLQRALARPRLLDAELERAQAATWATADPFIQKLIHTPRDRAIVELESFWRSNGLDPVGRGANEVVVRLLTRSLAAAAPRLNENQVDLIRRFLEIASSPDEALNEVASLASGEALDGALLDWRDRLSAFASAGIPRSRTTLAPGFGRAFGYYDGFLFEISSASLSEDAPIAAGGRYDRLLQQLGPMGMKPSAAVGCIVRPSRAWKGAAA